MNRIQQIHDYIEHDHKLSCSLYEQIEKVLEANQYFNDKETSDFYFNLAMQGIERDKAELS